MDEDTAFQLEELSRRAQALVSSLGLLKDDFFDDGHLYGLIEGAQDSIQAGVINLCAAVVRIRQEQV